MVRGAREYKIYEKPKFTQKLRNFLKNHKVHFKGRVGSIEGPRMVLDTMEVWSCVPRVPWNVFCCLVCKNIADTADFWWDDDCAPPRVK